VSEYWRWTGGAGELDEALCATADSKVGFCPKPEQLRERGEQTVFFHASLPDGNAFRGYTRSDDETLPLTGSADGPRILEARSRSLEAEAQPNGRSRC